MNMAADFSALKAKSGNNVSFGHPSNLGADAVHFLWRLRHNTVQTLKTFPAERKIFPAMRRREMLRQPFVSGAKFPANLA